MLIINKENLGKFVNENNIKIIMNFNIDKENGTMTIYYFDSLEDSAELKELTVNINIDELLIRFNELRKRTIENYTHWNKKVPNQTFNGYIHQITAGLLCRLQKDDYDRDDYSISDRKRKAFEFMILNNEKTYGFYREHNIECNSLYNRMFNNGVKTIVGKYNDSPDKKEVFDYVKLYMNINQCGLTREDTMNMIKKHKKSLINKGFQYVQKRVGDDMINFMKVDNIIYTNDSRLVITYVLKTESKALI